MPSTTPKIVSLLVACMENLLLTAISLGIGSCWIGEMLDRQFEVKDLLQVNKDRYDLMAIVSRLSFTKFKTPRKPLSECV